MVQKIIFAAALAGLAAATPAPLPQMLDLELINAAPDAATGPAVFAVEEDVAVVDEVKVTDPVVPGAATLRKRTTDWKCRLFRKCDNVKQPPVVIRYPITTTSVITTTATPTTTVTTSSTTSSTTTTTTPEAYTTTSEYTTAAHTTTAPVATTPAPYAGTCGVLGYDKQLPPAGFVDGSGNYATFASCKGLCSGVEGAMSFAYGNNFCLCYNAIVENNINLVDDSPFAFYDIGCAAEVEAPPTTSTSSSTTTTAEIACSTDRAAYNYCGDVCATQPSGYGTRNLGVEPFLNSAEFKQDAVSAPDNVQGYVRKFVNLQGSVEAKSYMGLHTLKSYDVNQCATFCEDSKLCTSFNIFIERNPSVNPDAKACPDPEAIANYKCTLWGSSIDSSMATNKGQWRASFQVVITASNGYDKTDRIVPTCDAVTTTEPTPTPYPSATTPATTVKPATTTTTTAAATPVANPPKWKPGKDCKGKAVNQPKRWMSSKVFQGAFNTQICADFAMAQNKVNRLAAVRAGRKSWTPSTYVNAVYYHRNGKPFGTYCNLFDVKVDASFETYTGGVLAGDRYAAKQSWTFELDVDADYAKC